MSRRSVSVVVFCSIINFQLGLRAFKFLKKGLKTFDNIPEYFEKLKKTEKNCRPNC